MTDLFVESFVDKLILLEQKAGAQAHYRVMQPLSAPFHNTVTIQKAAKDIADFIGLIGFTFIIAVVKQKDKVGGHIDLSTKGNEVFIEIDTDVMRYPDAVGAILCHELCHKWLHVQRIGLNIGYEDEILTDITTVFLGLGKIMLNGCKTSYASGTLAISETITSGYLDRDQLAFVYRLVCAMRNVPRSQFMDGLNAEAAQAIQSCDSLFGHHYGPQFHEMDTIQETIGELESGILTTQRSLAELDKHLIYVKSSFCEAVEGFIKTGHKKVISLRQNGEAVVQQVEVDPALRFLRAIQQRGKIDRELTEMQLLRRESEMFLKRANAIGHHLHRNEKQFPPPSSTTFNIVTCPQDGTKLRLPTESSELIAICPKCRYSFVYSTTVLSFPVEEVAPPRDPQVPWTKRFWKIFGRKRLG